MLEKNGEKKEKKSSVEESLKRLEIYVHALEEGEVGLDEAFEIFEKAVKQSNYIRKRLQNYERKIEIITDSSKENDQFEVEDFLEK